jgi:hypothetical protein
MAKIYPLFIFFLLGFFVASEIHDKPQEHHTTNLIIDKTDYELVIKKIQKFEGFQKRMYICPGGYKTIGYGLPYYLWNKPTITERQADSIFRVIFNEQMVLAHEKTGETGMRLLALTSAKCNLKDSSFNQLISNPHRWLEFNRASGKIMRGLTIRREWEYNLYVGNTKN